MSKLKTDLNNSMMFEAKYLGPTNNRGSRVKITNYDLSHRNNDKPKSVIISYNYEFNSSADIAQYWLETKGFELIAKNTRKSKVDVFMVKWNWDLLCEAFNIKKEEV